MNRRPIRSFSSAAIAFLAALTLAAPASAVVHGRRPVPPMPTGPGELAVIIELTAPPASRGNRAIAAAQRARMRQAIVSLDNQHRQARGLGARAAADVIDREYGVTLNGFAARLMRDTVAALKTNPDVRRVVADGRVQALLDVSVPLVRAPEFWATIGYRGAGTTIAVIDTGVDYTLADLGGCLGVPCKVIGGYDFVNGDGDPRDDNGHGTHVAATAAGNGALLGVAPDARILAYKVLDASGSGSFSAVIAGIERATDPNGDGNPVDHVTVVSMSLGGGGDENDPVSTAVDNASAAGVLSVIAAGNSGAYFTIGSPGTARTALTVGATDDQDAIAYFSSRGPTTVAFLLKPEITAPGVSICAATFPGAYPGYECLGSDHAAISGTSMATPHVSGAAALLRGLRPSLSPAEVKAILQDSAVPLGLDVTTGGAGRLDVRAAADVMTVLTPAPINLGLDDSSATTWVQSATVTLRNLGTVTRNYTLDTTDFPAGVTATITPDTVTVPPTSAATVTLTVTVDNALVPDTLSDTSPPLSGVAPFLHSGRLVATAGADQAAILVSFAKTGSGSTTGTKRLLTGRSLALRDVSTNPAMRQVVMQSSDPTLVAPVPASAADPTLVGADLVIVNPSTYEYDTYHLPSLYWYGLGNPAGAKGYNYKDSKRLYGPCSQVQLRNGKLKAKCKGDQIRFSLDEPFQGSVGLRLETGTTTHCALFGGAVTKDTATVGSAVGMFKASNAPAPAGCPSDPSSCDGNCGGFAGSCWCDTLCIQYGDCCVDFYPQCVDPDDSCEGDCGGYGGHCYCDAACLSYGDCCFDYQSMCQP